MASTAPHAFAGWKRRPARNSQLAQLAQLVHSIAQRIGRRLERQGLLERDIENSYLAADAVDEDPLNQLLCHSITYRVAVGPQQGRKVFTLQTLPASDPEHPFGDTVGKVAGFSLHAGVAARADERKKLERLCRYISRPTVSEQHLSLTPNGNVRYQLKTPYRDGTTHVIFDPLDFIAKLAALVPKPRVNLTRFHGVFAPNIIRMIIPKPISFSFIDVTFRAISKHSLTAPSINLRKLATVRCHTFVDIFLVEK